MNAIAFVAARIMLALLFILAGVNKLMDIGGTTAYIESASPLPGILAAPTGAFEVVAGLLLAIGKWPKIVAPIMAGFTILTIVFFHTDLSQQIEITLALKNLAIAGGLLMVYVHAAAGDSTG